MKRVGVAELKARLSEYLRQVRRGHAVPDRSMIAYVDSSVLLCVASNQPAQLAAWPQIRRAVTSALTEVECLRTLDRLHRVPGVREADVAQRRALTFDYLAEMEVVSIDAAVLSRASLPLPTLLGTLDAIHLATAILWQEIHGLELQMATHDQQLAAAAQACGLRVLA